MSSEPRVNAGGIASIGFSLSDDGSQVPSEPPPPPPGWWWLLWL
jgi:hypothetical protein